MVTKGTVLWHYWDERFPMARSVEFPAPGRGAYDRSLSRPERDAQHRERLLRAAAEITLESELTLSRIVERAGVGRSTFYEFFDSPEHVIAHLRERRLRAFDQTLNAAYAKAHTPLERLRAIVRGFINEAEAHPLEARVILGRCDEREALSPAGKLLHGVLERTAHAAQSAGVTVLGARDELSLLAATASVEVLTRRHLQSEPLHDAARVVTDLVLKLLRS